MCKTAGFGEVIVIIVGSAVITVAQTLNDWPY